MRTDFGSVGHLWCQKKKRNMRSHRKLVAEFTVDDTFIPFLIGVNAQLLHPHTCACTYIRHLLVLVSEAVPRLTV